jgi:hypothetical protein
VQRIVAEVNGLCLKDKGEERGYEGREREQERKGRPSSLTSQSTRSRTRAIPEEENGWEQHAEHSLADPTGELREGSHGEGTKEGGGGGKT